jgi:hypothetical protein
MRAKQIIDRYREFAARTHLAMAVLALGLVAAIIILMVVSAVSSQASFLVAESKNLVTMEPTSDKLLVSVAAVVFLAVLAAKFLDHLNATK